MLRPCSRARSPWFAVAAMIAPAHEIDERAPASLALPALFGYMDQPAGLVVA